MHQLTLPQATKEARWLISIWDINPLQKTQDLVDVSKRPDEVDDTGKPVRDKFMTAAGEAIAQLFVFIDKEWFNPAECFRFAMNQRRIDETLHKESTK